MIFVGIQASNGVIVGGIGNTIDEALSDATSGGVSEDFAMLWSDAMTEIANASEGAADAQRERLATVAANADAGSEAPVGDATGDSDSGSDAEADDDSPATPARSEEAAGEGPAEAAPAAEGGSPACAVCAEPVKPARAEVAIEKTGEVRCKTHTP